MAIGNSATNKYVRYSAASRSRSPGRCLLLLLLIMCGASAARAQEIEARINIVSLDPPRVRVEGSRASPARAWSFLQTYAGLVGLAGRIENLTLADASGAPVHARALALGEYEAERPAARFVYEVKLDPPEIATNTAHVSWLTNERGMLMLGDLLPGPVSSAQITFSVPAGWVVASTETRNSRGQFEIRDAEAAVFFVGAGLREQRRRANEMTFTLVTAGDWAFTDGELADSIARILKEHQRIAGGASGERAMVMLAPFPQAATPQRWSAETRGNTVVFLSGRAALRTAALAQLSVNLSHELFHLWVPNALALSGEYAWFYEGFTIYQATRVAMRLGFLSFQDYLDTMARAFDSYTSARGRESVSLLEASRRRWTGANSLVYSKGMLVAFLYDLNIRQQTRGRHSLDDAYRELFRRHRQAAQRTEGNTAVLAALNSAGVSEDLTRRLIVNAAAIELAAELAPFGLRYERVGGRSRVTVADSLSGAQRDLLRAFGYNTRS